MPSFRNIRRSCPSGRAAKEFTDIGTSDKRHGGTPYERPVKREPSESLLPSTPSISPSSRSSTAISDADKVSSLPELRQSPDLLSLAIIPPTARATNKKSHSRKREPGYVPRPRNSFIVFRSWWIDRQKESGEGQQNELSKQAGKAWAKMSDPEREPFVVIAHREQQLHKLQYPNYQYTPGPRAAARGKSKKVPKKRSRPPSGPRKRKAEEETYSVFSDTSTEPESPLSLPTRVRVTRAAAQKAVKRLEKIASSPSASPHVIVVSLPEASLEPASSPMVGEITVQNSSVAEESEELDEDFVSTEDIPALQLDPNPSSEEMKTEPKDVDHLFVDDCPPCMKYDDGQFGFNSSAIAEPYSQFPTLPNYSTPDLQEDIYGWQRPSRSSSPLATMDRSYESSPLLESSSEDDMSEESIAEFDMSSWICLSP